MEADVHFHHAELLFLGEVLIVATVVITNRFFEWTTRPSVLLHTFPVFNGVREVVKQPETQEQTSRARGTMTTSESGVFRWWSPISDMNVWAD